MRTWIYMQSARFKKKTFHKKMQALKHSTVMSNSKRSKRKKNCDNPKGFTMKQFCKNQKTRSKPGEKTNEELEQDLEETIKKIDDEYVVYPKKGGKRLGTHKTKKAAKKQLAAIEISKAKRGK